MSTSWQLSRGAELDWQYHRVEQLLRNVTLNAKRTRLILEEFEAGVKDSALELKYVSEAQFRVAAPRVEIKLLEAIKLEKNIQQLLEQNMGLQTTELRCQSDASVHSNLSYTDTPAGIYTPAYTPSTGIFSQAGGNSNISGFGQSPEGMESFPQSNTNMVNSALSLQTLLRNDAEVQNVENKQLLNSASTPRCNLIFRESDTSLYSPEYVTPKMGHNGNMEYVTPRLSHNGSLDLPNVESEKTFNNIINKNESNDAYIDIPDEVFDISTSSMQGCEFQSANNTVASDAFLTPRSELNQENTNKEIVIEIETNDQDESDLQVEGFNASESKILKQQDHIISSKRKRESACDTPIKNDESKDNQLNESKNVNAISDSVKDLINDANIEELSESKYNNIIKNCIILNNSQGVIDNSEVQQTSQYVNKSMKNTSLESPILQMKDTKTVVKLPTLLEQGSSENYQDLAKITKDNTNGNNNNNEASNLEVLEETYGVTEGSLLHGTENLQLNANGHCLMTDTEVKTACTTLNKETVINCENVMHDTNTVPQTIPPLEQYTSVYVTHFEAPNRVWIQLEDCGIENFQYEINYVVRQPVPEELVSVNSIVHAPFGDSNELYRAQVMSIINRKETQVKVIFLDYGNSELVNVSSLVRMPEAVMNVSCKAIPCFLEKVNGTDLSSWSENVDMLFSQLVNNTPFYAYIKQYENEPMERTLEYEESEVSRLKPRYVITLSEVLETEIVKPHEELSIVESKNEVDLDLTNENSSSSSTSYLSYHGSGEKEVCLNKRIVESPNVGNNSDYCEIPDPSLMLPKIVKTLEYCEITLPKPDANDHRNENAECVLETESDNICEINNNFQKIASDGPSNIEVISGPSEISGKDITPQTNDIAAKDIVSQEKNAAIENEKIHIALQGLCILEKTVNKNANKSPQKKGVDPNKVKKSQHKKDSETKMVSEPMEEVESTKSNYFGKWSCLKTEYTLNAAGKVVDFNSNEKCKVKSPGNNNTLISNINSSVQKSCRKRDMSGNATASRNTLGTKISEKDLAHKQKYNTRSEIHKKSRERRTSEKQPEDNIKIYEKQSTHICLPSPDGKQCPISGSGSGSGSEIFIPVEVLPVVKIAKQTVSLGADEQIPVMVSHVDSPHSFFLHLINSETASIERFNETMTEHYKNDCDILKVERLPVGSFWAVRWNNNCWYRAQVLASLTRKAKEELHLKVRYVDHGDSGIISIKDVRVLAETFTFMPMLALPCSLAQVSPLNEWEENPWTQQSIEGFIDLIGKFTTVLQANFISYSLNAHFDIVLENEFGVINEMMVKKGFAKSLKLQNIGMDIFPGFINADDASMINNASESPAVDGLSKWDPMSESYSNGLGYQNDECAEILISGMKNTDLSRLCKFYRVDGKCPRGVTCRFEHKLLNKAHTVEKEAVIMDLHEEPNLPKEESVIPMIVTYVESPGLFYCFLPHGVSDLRQHSGRDSGIGLANNGELMDKLLLSMCDHYRHSLPTPHRALPAIGELRAAPLPSEEGELEWWRVRVLEISGNELGNLNVKVHFLDYGEVKWVKEMELRPLDVQFLHMPAQALESWLYDVPIPQTGWTLEAKNHFTDLTKDRILVGHILHCDESMQRLGVKLYDTTGNNEIIINDVMMNYN